MSAASSRRCWVKSGQHGRSSSRRSGTRARSSLRSKRDLASSSTASSGPSPDACGAHRMPSLKDLRNRIRSVRSTQKITSAMKVVAASRLRRAVEQVEAARPYGERMERVLASLASRMAGLPGAPPLLVGTDKHETHLLIVATSDRGLAGGFNASILRETRRRVRELLPAGKTVMVLTIGRKGRDGLRRDYGRLIRDSLTDIGRRRLAFDEAHGIAGRILVLYGEGGFDVCTIVYNRF